MPVCECLLLALVAKNKEHLFYLGYCSFGSSVILGQIQTDLMPKDTGIAHETHLGVHCELNWPPEVSAYCIPPYFGLNNLSVPPDSGITTPGHHWNKIIEFEMD